MAEVIANGGVHGPQLFLDVEDKTAEALTTYHDLPACTYQTKTTGCASNRKRGPEFMTCDCEENWDPDTETNLACGDDSNCINRITSIECVNRHCGCGEDCQNQRFQKRQYADVSVFQTELKGYGLKANSEIKEGQFIYEYIGEVIDEATFRKKMIEYDLKRYKHFYFMMLKNDAFIDATEKGSLARFVNHSCSPNAFVDKWNVGDRLRMGIFAKRRIQAGEEISFDYNVDRYGAQSQPCYCGEPNCLKFMGGKTQTDAALLLPEGISEALGVNSRIEKAWLKENKHLRSKQQADDATINEMFVQSLTVLPMAESDVSKVMGALMKAQQVSLIKKLIERIHITDDKEINRLFVKFHGYKTLSNVLQDSSDDELILMVLEILARWPAMTKNKISSSQIEDVVKEIQENSMNEQIKSSGEILLKQWSQLQMAYRIPKVSKPANLLDFDRKSKSPEREDDLEILRAAGYESLPSGWSVTYDTNSQRYYFYNKVTMETRWNPPDGVKPLLDVQTPIIPTGPKAQASFNDYRSHENNNHNNNNHHHNRGDQQGEPRKSNFGFVQAEISRRVEEREQQARESKARELAEKDRLLREMIVQAQQEAAATAQPAEKKSKLANGEHRDHHLHKSKHKHHHQHKRKHHGSEHKAAKEDTIELQWKRLLAKHVTHFVKKHQDEIGRESVKGCTKEIVTKLAGREASKPDAAPPPADLDKHKYNKVKEYTATFMNKFLTKYRTRKDKKKKTTTTTTLDDGGTSSPNGKAEESAELDVDENMDASPTWDGAEETL
ncbi:uncharacterized protein LODBEIA_P37790 [Lodderomyces beijingensis]|uniref:Histone-lysine N-methyltransferase, H3 lysine-36 specific n=1 Tax=Lodderomyces beijingensis TaxID=1775926 RepID=A0ABP0ZTR4_9ASCO